MMLDIDFAELNEGFSQYMPIGATIGLILLLELLLIFGASTQLVSQSALPQATPEGMTNAEAIGRVCIPIISIFPGAGAVLLVP